MDYERKVAEHFKMILKTENVGRIEFSSIYLCHIFAEMLVQEFIDEQTKLFRSTHFIGHCLLILVFKPNAKILAFRTKRIDDPNANNNRELSVLQQVRCEVDTIGGFIRNSM